MTPELPWYARLREEHRPDRVRVLLIGESAPDPGTAERRFFYAPVLDRYDNLFRGVVAAFYGGNPGRAGDSKAPWLARLKADGVFLIDLVPYPVNKLLNERTRAKARRDHVTSCIETVRAIDPAGVIVCHKPTFLVLSVPMRAVKLPLLHDEPILFPMSYLRDRFVVGVRAASRG